MWKYENLKTPSKVMQSCTRFGLKAAKATIGPGPTRMTLWEVLLETVNRLEFSIARKRACFARQQATHTIKALPILKRRTSSNKTRSSQNYLCSLIFHLQMLISSIYHVNKQEMRSQGTALERPG